MTAFRSGASFRTGQPGDSARAAEVFAAHRERLVGVAYRLLGRMADAEDVVQEAWLRWMVVDLAAVQDSRAFLVRVTTRLAIDRLRRIKARREEYVGPWLPDPVLGGAPLAGPDPAEEVELAESVSLALLVVLETLSPLERAVFVLHDVFGMGYPEVAEAVGRSDAAVRQLAARARAHVEEKRPRYASDAGTQRRVTEHFLEACATGDVGALMAVLAPDVTLIADSGGKARAPRVPLRGAEVVTRFLMAIVRPENTLKFLASIGIDAAALGVGDQPDAALAGTLVVRAVEVNGTPGIVAWLGERVITVLSVDVVEGKVATVHLIANPEKLSRLSAPGEMGAPAMSQAERGTASLE